MILASLYVDGFHIILSPNKDIKTYFLESKASRISSVVTGNGGGGNLLKAVKIAKNLTTETIPSNLTLGGVPVAPHEAANAFVKLFHEKITSQGNKTRVAPTVYNGKKLVVQNRNFMQKCDVKECMQSLK